MTDGGYSRRVLSVSECSVVRYAVTEPSGHSRTTSSSSY